MRVLFIAKPLSSAGNGVVVALRNQLKYFQKKADVALFNLGANLDDDIASLVFMCDKYKTIKSLPREFSNPDLVVFEEVYKIEYIKLYKECIKNNIPYVIIPHGCLVKPEQNKKRLKHIIANLLFFNRFIKKAEAVEFLNKNEKGNSHFKYKKSIIIPNAIEIKKLSVTKKDKFFRCVYIGRYAVITKGLDLLIETFIDLKQWCIENNVLLELYGPIEESEELTLLKRKIVDNKCENFISINGPIYGKEKENKLKNSSLFIQTSRNEGQPMGIMDALSFGVPCIVTFGTNFGDYCNNNKCGIGIDFSKKNLEKALKKLYDDKKFLKECQKNAYIVIKKDFDIKKISDLRIKKYSEIIKKNE